MFLLIITTILWAFSFSLIGEYLAGQVDSWFSVLMRVGLAALVFLPFLRWRNINWRVILLYMTVGAIQLGIMYLFSFRAYLYLSVPEFLLFTVMTPLYVTLIYDLLRRQRLRWSYALSALLAVVGAAIIRYDHLSEHFWWGLILVQAANICFAIGQVGYKRLMEVHPIPQHVAFSWFYVGALVVAIIAWFAFGNPQKLPTTSLQWGVLVWLGVGASALGYFMWNYGATQVDAGTLGIMNNVHVPAGLLVNLAIWQEKPHWPSFIIGAIVIMASLWVHRRWVAPHSLQTADSRKRVGGPNE
ncbi:MULTISPECIES: carboxylate/amino acid/amine transporter [Yersinia]|uniref:Carboxylate/amino acid/amine transporter family protein n=1 Tax=Yersinia rochesterensis TaxID=1604335 RepID=A0A386H9L1_9GAMM|nr:MULTISPECIES: carboxylate/amino acid/amine transporter [Yersinia]AJI88565.1 carboxylate/amino acid/amine transporter family protein [Yersinia frederiksenii Y225]CNH97409.1 membrane protein [Yersinia kristensenii]AIN19333.1 carboxylate/amino acid/amine transporter family protein [Yersinia rochesterensis]AJJ35060.1 carboxylate/amino acid/amine transporter family protein [Yersinia rochesterensis]AYD42517.1 DMT family transporter [Yersinia rochesterensis]